MLVIMFSFLSVLSHYFSGPRAVVSLLLSTFLIQVLSLATPLFAIIIIQKYLTYQLSGTYWALALGVSLAILLEYIMRQKRANLINSLSIDLLERYDQKQWCYFENMSKSHLYHQNKRIQSPLAESLSLAGQHIGLWLDIPFIILTIGVVCYLNMKIGVVIIVAAIFAVIASLIHHHMLFYHQEEQQQYLQIKQQYALRSANRGMSFWLFQWSNQAGDHWFQNQDKLNNCNFFGQQLFSKQTHLNTFLTSALTVALYLIGSKMIIQGELSLGLLIAVNILGSRCLIPFTRIIESSVALSKAHKQWHMFDDAQPLELSIQNQSIHTLSFKSLVLPTVIHSSTPEQSLNITLAATNTLAIIGGSGHGKTSCLKLLLGSLKPKNGLIQVNERPLSDWSPSHWWSHIHYLPQTPSWSLGLTLESLLRPKQATELWRYMLAESSVKDLIANPTISWNTSIDQIQESLPRVMTMELALLQAALVDKPLVFIDEPLSGFYGHDLDRVQKILGLLMDSNKTVVVTGSQSWLIQRSKQVLYLPGYFTERS